MEVHELFVKSIQEKWSNEKALEELEKLLLSDDTLSQWSKDTIREAFTQYRRERNITN